MRKILSGTFAVALFMAFAFEGVADAKGKAGGSRSRATKSAKPGKAKPRIAKKPSFKGFGGAKRPKGFRTGLSAKKGKRGGGMSGMFSKTLAKKGKATKARGKMGRGIKAGKGIKAAKGKASKFKRSGKALSKFNKFKKLGGRMMKKGGMSKMLSKFRGAARGGRFLRGGPFSLAGKLTKGRTGMTGMFSKFFGGKRAGMWNKTRGMLGHLKNLGGKGLGQVGKFARNFGAKFKHTMGKMKTAVSGAFNKIKNSPIFKRLAPAAKAALSKLLEQAKSAAVEGVAAQGEQMGTAAVETATENAVGQADPANAEVAEADPGVPAAVTEQGEPTDAPAAEVTAPAEVHEAVDTAAQEAGVETPPAPAAEEAPAADAPAADAPAADAPAADAPAADQSADQAAQ